MRSLLILSVVACSHGPIAAPGSAGSVSLGVVVDALPKPSPDVFRKFQEGLTAHGYQVSVIPNHHFAGHRSTTARLRVLSERAVMPSHQLLVEVAAEPTSQMGGAYRWEVTTALSLVLSGQDGDPVAHGFHVPVFRQHETDGLGAVVLAAAPDLIARSHRFLTKHQAVSAPVTGGGYELPSSRRPIYLVMVDRFSNGDASNDGKADPTRPIAFHGGDLQGVLDRVEWIKELGMGQIWLTPVARSRALPFEGHSAFHGYWTEDLREWDPRFGQDGVASRLRKELNRHHMRLILDLVVNHVDYDAPLVEQHPHWFHQAGDVVDFRDSVQRMTGRVHGLPDLDQDVPEVFAYLSSAARTWHERLQPDGYRLDAVQHVAPAFTKPFGDLLRTLKEPAPVVLGEVFEGDVKALSEAFIAHGLDQAFDFPLYYAMKSVFCEGGHLGKVGSIFSVDALYPDAHHLVTFLDNHDLPRIHSACAGDGAAVDRALAFLFASRGVPSITYGTEVGLAGVDTPENRGDMRFVSHPLRARIATLAGLRDRYPALHSGATRILEVGDHHLVILRYIDREGALVVVNHGREALDVEMPKGLVLGSVLEGELEISAHQLKIPRQSLGVVEVGGAFLQGLRSSLAKVTLEVKNLPDPEGEYRLVGLGPRLGHWAPGRGVPIQAGRAVLEGPPHSIAEFKVVQIKGGRPIWEPRDNRYLHLSPAPTRVEIKWGR